MEEQRILLDIRTGDMIGLFIIGIYWQGFAKRHKEMWVWKE